MLDILEATFTIRPSARSQAEGITQPYTTTVINGRAYCDCPGYEGHSHCKHGDEALAVVEAARTPDVVSPPIPLAERGQLNGDHIFHFMR